MKTVIIYTFSFLLLLISACSKDKIPGVYRIDIQQGNDITQEMIGQLKPGMSKSQVAYVMGTPLIIDTFHPDRWDYLYSFHPGNGQREQRRITVYFKQDKLDYLNGDTRIVPREELPEIVRIDSNVVVPLSDKKVGLIHEIKNSIGLEDDDVVDAPEEKPDLFKNRPIPVPKKSTGLIDRITGSVSSDDTEDTIQEVEAVEEPERPSLLKRFIGSGNDETADELPLVIEQIEIEQPPVVEQPTIKEPSFFSRIKNAIGLGDEAATD